MADDDAKPRLIGAFGYQLEWLESEWERARRLEVEAEQQRAREVGLAAVENEILKTAEEPANG